MTGQIKIEPFSLRNTMECGQFFRYTKIMNIYIVQSSNQIFSLYQKDGVLFYEGIDESFLTNFFRLDENLNLILKEIDQDPVIHQAIQKYRGLRLIRQDPWECLISFLCSSAKTISQIRTIIESLCKSTGNRIVYGNYIGFTFPEPSCLGNLIKFEDIPAGFRKIYLMKASQSIDRNQLLKLKGLSYFEAKKRLVSLTGVGKKIADCTLLYSLDFLEAFPIDTWIKRGLKKFYFHGKRVGEREIEEFVHDHFGRYAGYAQLYLYHFWRNHGL